VEFDIALSFAGEDRPYVDRVANLLRDRGIRVFYDKFEESSLWGKNLYDYLTDVYTNKARYTIMFISKYYAQKSWASLERQSMQARAFQENEEYILPARFDDTTIPGVPSTVGYLSLSEKTPAQLVALIEKKLINSGATIPSEHLRKAFSTIVRLPKADPVTLSLRVRSESGSPISQAKITAIAENGTTIGCSTDTAGFAKISFNVRRTYDLLIAHPNHPATIIERIDPSDDLEIIVADSENIGSSVFHSTGHIPGLSGRLNPILDPSNRTWVYADNIAVNGGVNQPASFSLNVPLEMEDANGAIFMVTFKFIRGRTSLAQYLKPVFRDH
jgi:hypothetical protein